MEAIRVFGSKLSIGSQTSAFPPCKLSPFPLTQFSSKPLHLIPLKATTIPLACDDKENNRKFEKLGPSEWGHQFLSAHVDLSEMEALGREIEALKPKVRDMFKSFKGKIDILDPLISGNDLKKVKRIMNPIVEMLPGLIRDELTSPTAYPRPETFTFERVVAISQNERTGDCGPFAVKLIELHGQGLGVDGITDEMVDNFRLIYAMDVYEEFVGAISN